jgi:hypothetical protein
MHRRCNQPTHQSYPHYGGRGISVCEEWKDFWTFVSDMGERPEGHTLERVDNDLGYCKENCIWATHKEQCNNRRPRKRPPNAKGFTKTSKGRYAASYYQANRKIHIGVFDCPLMAHLAYRDAVDALQ